MPETTPRRQWQQLYDALSALAAEAPDQIARVSGGHPDDLALDFDAAAGTVASRTRIGFLFSPDTIALLQTLDGELLAMSGARHADLWTHDGLLHSEQWSLVRALAREALAVLPPSP